MSEKDEIWERKNFYKWIALVSIILALLFGLGMCSPLYNAKHKIPNYIKEGDQNHSGYNVQDGKESKTLLGSEKKTSNYQINLPYNKYLVLKPITLNRLAQRWHCSVGDIAQANPIYEDQNPNEPIQPEKPINVPSGKDMEGWEKSVLDLTNKERAKAGLPALKGTYTELNKSSHAKAQDMIDKNYFDHNSPTYGSPFDMMKTFSVKYSSAGENIAIGQQSPEEVVSAWMNSAGHRANILNSSFDYMGVGYVKCSNKFAWVQQFVKKS